MLGIETCARVIYGSAPSRNGVHLKAIWEVSAAKIKTVPFLWASRGFESSEQLIWHLAEVI